MWFVDIEIVLECEELLGLGLPTLNFWDGERERLGWDEENEVLLLRILLRGDESESGGVGGAWREEIGVFSTVSQEVPAEALCSRCWDCLLSKVGEAGKARTADCGGEEQERFILEDQGKWIRGRERKQAEGKILGKVNAGGL